VPNLQNLRRACDELLANEQRRSAYGRRAAAVVKAKRGAIDATLDLLERALEIQPADDA
jgi:3-deoxy-D-manno-octulosonic-acid transferase